MRTKKLSDLLKKGDRVAVSNITGREASRVSEVSQKYSGNIIGGWALGKGGQKIETPAGIIPVFATFEELLRMTPREQHPNKVLVYSPPEAVYGEVKEIIAYGEKTVETIYIVTEHVSIEVTAKIYQICSHVNIDVLGCNTLGVINSHDRVRIGAVGGDSPEDTFRPGSVTVISNSGNMVNTISSYLLSIGMGTSFGISTGKDRLILFPMKDLLLLAENDENTKIIVLYVEPGGTYEHDAVDMMKENGFSKPVVVYVSGEIAEKYVISLGHAGAVVEGCKSHAKAKKDAFDSYFGIGPMKMDKHYRKTAQLADALSRGIRAQALHHIPRAVTLVANTLGMTKDFGGTRPVRLNPWFVNLGELGRRLPAELAPAPGNIPGLFDAQFKQQTQNVLGGPVKQSMRNASHASSSDGVIPRIYGYSMLDIMKRGSFTSSVILYLTGELPESSFEEKLAEMTLIASLTNGPGTISLQGSKLSASAGNNPNTAMIAALATMGTVHGGNGARAVKFLLDCFGGLDISDPGISDPGISDPYKEYPDVGKIAEEAADDFKKKKQAAKEGGFEYERVPCLGHPVFRNDPVNYDPREQVIYNFIKESGRTNIFLDFYHHLAVTLKDRGCTAKVLAVNVDAAIACVWLGICWKQIREKKMTLGRVVDIPFIVFALGRAAGGAGEFLDHRDFGTELDMRIPVKDCRSLTRPREL